MEHYLINIETENQIKQVEAIPKSNLLVLLQQTGVNIRADCGGIGKCGKCKVKIKNNNQSSKTTSREQKLLAEKEIKQGIRLACEMNISSNLTVEIIQENEIKVFQNQNEVILNKINPLIKYEIIKLPAKNKINNLGIANYFKKELSFSGIILSALKKLSHLYQLDFTPKKAAIIYDNNKNLVRDIIVKPEKDLKIMGIAVDIGTTTIAFYLHDLVSGNELAKTSTTNSQVKYGSDIISRMNYVREKEAGLQTLKQELIKGLNKKIKELCDEKHFDPNNIYQLNIAANTVILHLLTGINTSLLSSVPYKPIFTNKLNLVPEKLNLNINSGGIITIMESMGGFIGSDISAGLIACDFDKINKYKTILFIDVGTNGEIIIKQKNKFAACSAAAGPAFEGGNISFGMAAIPGAIKNFKITENEINFTTIEQKEPTGICGSGLLDIIDEFIQHTVIDCSGKFTNENKLPAYLARRITTYQDNPAFQITAENNNIYITQSDIREIQLAISAIRTGIDILLQEIGINKEDLDQILLAGGFGNNLNINKAVRVGLLPQIEVNKIKQAGNTAGHGAQKCLLKNDFHNRISNLKDNIRIINLSERKDFQKSFVNNLKFD